MSAMTPAGERPPAGDRVARTGGLVALIELWVRLPRFVRAMVPVAGVIVLWWSSSQVPSESQPSTTRMFLHNTMHVVAYGCLAASVWLAWSARPACRRQAFRSRGVWLLTTLYGVVDELHQSYVPGRVCSLADLASDALGAALAVILLCGVSGVTPAWRRVAVILILGCLASVALATFADL